MMTFRISKALSLEHNAPTFLLFRKLFLASVDLRGDLVGCNEGSVKQNFP
jgi:hypothetical protein